MYRFALRPKWILGHLLVVALVAVLASLGFWQLRRLEERREVNALVEQRSRSTTALPAEGWEGADPAGLVYRRVRVRGRYDAGGEVLLRFRSRNGVPGHHVLTPLVTDQGTVIVDRGWVPLAVAEEWPTPDTAPPPGPVEVTGMLRPSTPGGFRPQRSRPDAPLTVGSVDLAALSGELSRPLHPLYVQVEAPPGPAASYPAPAEHLPMDEGPHLSYAVQWFIFATGAAVGWPILVRQSAHASARKRDPGEGENAVATPPPSRPRPTTSGAR